MSDAPAPARVRLMPVLAVAALAALALKAAGLSASLAGAAAASPAPAERTAPPPAGADPLLNHLASREAALDARERELDTRAKVLAAAEARIGAAAAALEQEKQAIALSGETGARLRDGDLAALSSAYERMKARDAARIFDILDDDILIPVASGMRTQALAGVLAEMSAERAKALTIALANREPALALPPAGPATPTP